MKIMKNEGTQSAPKRLIAMTVSGLSIGDCIAGFRIMTDRVLISNC